LLNFLYGTPDQLLDGKSRVAPTYVVSSFVEYLLTLALAFFGILFLARSRRLGWQGKMAACYCLVIVVLKAAFGAIGFWDWLQHAPFWLGPSETWMRFLLALVGIHALEASMIVVGMKFCRGICVQARVPVLGKYLLGGWTIVLLITLCRLMQSMWHILVMRVYFGLPSTGWLYLHLPVLQQRRIYDFYDITTPYYGAWRERIESLYWVQQIVLVAIWLAMAVAVWRALADRHLAHREGGCGEGR
jgi:hypothetical protein